MVNRGTILSMHTHGCHVDNVWVVDALQHARQDETVNTPQEIKGVESVASETLSWMTMISGIN